MAETFGARVTPIENVPWMRQPKAQTRLWSSVATALARQTRWSSLTVASYICGQLGLMFVSGKWRPQAPAENTMRGVDFYPWRDFLRAVIHGAHLFKAENGCLPRLASPVTFNEHLFVRKFFAALPMPSLSDKLAAKDYVQARLGDYYLPPVAWVGDDVADLMAAKVPPGRYVLKANHGWNWNLFLNLPGDLSIKRDEIKQAMSWLNSKFGYDWGEWHYCTIKPRLFLEEFIDFNGVETPDDYKILCFNGNARLIEVDINRSTDVRSAFYTPDWKYIPVTYGEPPFQRPRPRNLEEMIRAAETIAGEMEFARVDLYSDGNSRIRFGEITFTPGNAGLHFSDLKLDEWLGSQFGNGPVSNIPWDSENAR